MVDILCGVLSGGKCGPNLGAWRKAENQGPADISHCFIAINPVGFNPDFQNAVQVKTKISCNFCDLIGSY